MQWQYFCKRCGYERQGLLPVPWGIGGYAWACPECKSHDIDSRPGVTARRDGNMSDEELQQAMERAWEHITTSGAFSERKTLPDDSRDADSAAPVTAER
jgi:hypothetical protein